MKKSDIQIGGTYTAKVTDKVVEVRIDSENRNGGWHATNLATGKKIRIKSAQRLRGAVAGATEQPAKKRRKKADADAPKKLSALDAAAQVLQSAGSSMRCKEMIEAMTTQGLWTSPGGKTPEATLYSAILREISTKGEQARFRKTERGQFKFAASEA